MNTPTFGSVESHLRIIAIECTYVAPLIFDLDPALSRWASIHIIIGLRSPNPSITASVIFDHLRHRLVAPPVTEKEVPILGLASASGRKVG